MFHYNRIISMSKKNTHANNNLRNQSLNLMQLSLMLLYFSFSNKFFDKFDINFS